MVARAAILDLLDLMEYQRVEIQISSLENQFDLIVETNLEYQSAVDLQTELSNQVNSMHVWIYHTFKILN